MNIRFRAEGQALTRIDNEIVAADSKGFLYAEFEVDSEWDGLTLEAVFEYNGKSYVRLLAEGVCLVPAEVLNTGGFKVWLVGIDASEAIRATTDYNVIEVRRGPGYDAENAAEPTPTEREQLITIATNASDIAQSVRDDADNGEFDGKDGADGKSFEVFSTPDELNTYPDTTTADNVRFIWAGEDFRYNMVSLKKYGVYDAEIKTVGNNRVLVGFEEQVRLSGDVNEESIKAAVDKYLEENPPKSNLTVDSELSEKSTNPIQNKAVAVAITEVKVTIGNIDALLETI